MKDSYIKWLRSNSRLSFCKRNIDNVLILTFLGWKPSFIGFHHIIVTYSWRDFRLNPDCHPAHKIWLACNTWFSSGYFMGHFYLLTKAAIIIFLLCGTTWNSCYCSYKLPYGYSPGQSWFTGLWLLLKSLKLVKTETVILNMRFSLRSHLSWNVQQHESGFLLVKGKQINQKFQHTSVKAKCLFLTHQICTFGCRAWKSIVYNCSS